MRHNSRIPRRSELIAKALLLTLAIVAGYELCASLQSVHDDNFTPPASPVLAAVAAPLVYRRKDNLLTRSHALPNGAATTQSASGIDLGTGDRSAFLADGELLINAPALATGLLPDGQTITYSLEFDDDSAFGSISETVTLFVQTGAGGAGAAAVERRYKPASTQAQHVRLKTVKTGAANASTASATLSVVY